MPAEQSPRPIAALTLVPTPIGNLEDMTLRALRILKEADGLLTEDTRSSGQLLKLLGISNKLQSYHANNEHTVLESVLVRMRAGEKLALISDAGTPAISDPGFLLVRACIKEGFDVECLPGPVAFVPALVVSGLPADRFIFEGFLPVKKGRQTRLNELALESRTVILYESPHRVLKTLTQLALLCGPDRQASVSRELTKFFEQTLRGSLSQLISHFTTHAPKGEFVIVFQGKP